MALDKQISIYGIDTGHFFSNKERVLYNRNSKLRWEKAKLKSESEKILSKIKSDFSEEELQYIQKGHTLPLVQQSETEEILLQYRRSMNLIKMKNQKIKQSKQELLEILKQKMDLNLSTDGRHHKRCITAPLTEKDRINIFDSSITRLMGDMYPYQLSDDLMVIQVFFFDVFKDIFYYGFTYNGEEYIYLTSSAGQIRTKKAVFIKKSFYEKNEKTIMCGLTLQEINEKGGNNPNKHFAYMALANSATDEWTDFDIDRCIVVDDFETAVFGTYDLIDDTTYTVQRKQGDVPIPHMDGAGAILPTLSEYNFMIRLPWIKGLLGVFDYVALILEKGWTPIVKDIYGQEHDVIKENIQIIFTKSQFKLWKYYDSWDHYKECFKKYNCKAGICNHESSIENMHVPNVTINYQMLQTLTDITDAEFHQLIERTNIKITDLCSSVRNLQQAFQVTPGNHRMSHLQQAIQIYPDVINDDYMKATLRDIKNSMVKNARAGKLSIKGKYTFLLPDFYAFCEWLFGGISHPQGLLNDQEVYCRLFTDSSELDCLRSPHLYKEHAVRKNMAYTGSGYNKEREEEISKWFQTDGVYTSTHDMISKVLQFDVDGDKSLVIADQNFIQIAKRNMEGIVPLYYNMRKSEPVQLTKESMYHGLINAFVGGNIGMYSNDISKIWNCGVFQTGSEEEKADALEVIKLLCMENNFVIDYAKTLYKPVRPEGIHERIVKYTKRKLPHFFIFAKDKQESQVEPVGNSLVDRLFTAIANPRINLRKAGLKPLDYTLLMKNTDIEVNEEVIEKYTFLNRHYKFKISQKNEYEEKMYHISKYIKNELATIGYSEEELSDMLTKYLYTTEKSGVAKDVLWFSYGKYIVLNLKKNLSIREPKINQCVDCLDWFYSYASNVKRCPVCQKKYRQLQTKANTRKNATSSKTREKNGKKGIQKIRFFRTI